MRTRYSRSEMCIRDRKKIDAVITVEASFVMAVVLFICGALISQGFYVHERNTGMLILMDALEQTLSLIHI